MIVRPKLFLDTNILINAANGEIAPDEWRFVRKHVAKRFRYFISFTTMKELFSKLACGSDDYFHQNKRPLELMYNFSDRRFLPYPSVFAMRTLLGAKALSRKCEYGDWSDEDLAKKELAGVLQAPSKAALRSGIAIRNSPSRLWSFDLDHFHQHENGPQREFAEILQGLREDRTDMPERLVWASYVPRYHGIEATTNQCEKLAGGLDAAYRFQCALTKMSKDNGYDFRKHESNWGDATQLFYLCDESMHFVTLDANCQRYVKGSHQEDRVINYRDFVKHLTC